MEKGKNKLRRTIEAYRNIFSPEEIRRLYDLHVTNYNEKTSKKEAYGDLKFLSSQLEQDMIEIKNNLKPYDFDPHIFIYLEENINRGIATIKENFKFLTNLVPKDLKFVTNESLDYLRAEMSWNLIQSITCQIGRKQLPYKIPFWKELTETEKENVKKSSKPGPKTPIKLKDDIETIIEDIQNEPEFLNKNEELVINKAVEYAIKHPIFSKRWVDEEKALKKGGYSKRRLITLFSQQYKDMKS